MSKKVVRLLPSKRIAPSWVAYFCAVAYLYFGVVAVAVLHFKNYALLWSVPVLVLILLAMNYSLSWYKYAELYPFSDYVVYELENLVGVLGRNRSRYEIKSITKIHRKSSSVTLYGEIYNKEPMQKLKPVKKVVIYDITDVGMEIVMKVMRYS